MAKESRVMTSRPVLRHWRQVSRIRGCGMVLNSTGRNRSLWQVAYELIPAGHEYFESLTWPCMIVRWHHWRHKRSHGPFFRCLFERLPVHLGPSPSDSTKKNLSDQSLWFWSAVLSWTHTQHLIKQSFRSNRMETESDALHQGGKMCSKN